MKSKSWSSQNKIKKKVKTGTSTIKKLSKTPNTAIMLIEKDMKTTKKKSK